MVVFVVDNGLNKLRDQVDEAAPNRSKASDGSVGDPDHAQRESDHNPEDTADADAPNNPDNQVDARDITHDPANGADMGVVTESIRLSKDKRVKYVIFNERIFYGTLAAKRNNVKPYVWYAYHGTNPHGKHAHFSVEDATHDQTQPWEIGIDMPSAEEYANAVVEKLYAKTTKVPGTDTAGPNGTRTPERSLPVLLDDAQLRDVDTLKQLGEVQRILADLTSKVNVLLARTDGAGTPGA